MLVKLTSKNRITIPKKVLSKLPKATSFEVGIKDCIVMLKPVKLSGTNLEIIRAKMKKLGLSETSISDAVRWSRSK
jgi:bifunctional DNA-binding transcriptional regulator/antitoxin component of YhaV-PrlF toxin-antitoxin module